MDILSKSDDEIYELAKPIWDNLVKFSTTKLFSSRSHPLYGRQELSPY